MAQSIKLGNDTYLSATGIDGIKGIIASGDDLNNYYGVHKSGVYYIDATGTAVSNCPVGYSALFVISSGANATVQICTRNDGFYVRSYAGSPLAWTHWRSATLTDIGS